MTSSTIAPSSWAAAACAVALGVVTACSGSSATTRSQQLPYPVAFVNDTHADVVVRGCPACGTGHQLAAGDRWVTAVNGGDTEIAFVDAAGVRVGCAHLMNGVLPAKGAPPQQIDISQDIPCRV